VVELLSKYHQLAVNAPRQTTTPRSTFSTITTNTYIL